MSETYGLTILALFIMAVVAAPWSIGGAVSMFRSGRRGPGLLRAGLGLLSVILAIYLVFQVASLSFLKPIPELPFLWDLLVR